MIGYITASFDMHQGDTFLPEKLPGHHQILPPSPSAEGESTWMFGNQKEVLCDRTASALFHQLKLQRIGRRIVGQTEINQACGRFLINHG
jgi:hypothetical protein